MYYNSLRVSVSPWLFLVLRLCVSAAIICSSISFSQPPPKREFRAAWVASVANLDWPTVTSRGTNPEPQKAELISLLDGLKAAGITCVIFQIRPECDALYNSPYEPWSFWLTGTQGAGPATPFDPLAFAVEESHKRGMELHAWYNPYRAERAINNYNTAASHVTKTHPEWILTFNTSSVHLKILNPGLPEVREFVARVVADIIRRYDVDGVHADDYFYPYDPIISTEDATTFQNYSRGITNIGDWRRDNVNLLMKMIADSSRAIKPFVKVGMSPFGIWKSGVPAGISGLNAYSEIYGDAIAWLHDGSIDYLTPQLYWKITGAQDFQKLVNWWGDSTAAYGRHLYPGHAAYHEGDGTYTAAEMPNQIKLSRANPKVGGNVYFRALQGVLDNPQGFLDSLKTNYYHYPSLHPVMAWKDVVPPYPVRGIKYALLSGTQQTAIQWDLPLFAPDGDSASRYAVYRFDHYPSRSDFDDARNMLSVEGQRWIVPPAPGMPGGPFYFAVTALDRNYNESDTSNILTISPPAAPLLAGPNNGGIGLPDTVRLTWFFAPAVGSYHLQVGTDSTFLSGVILNAPVLTDTAKSITNLLGQQRYYWHVRATNAGGTSAFSPTASFVTGMPTTPTLVFPPHAMLDVPVTVTLRWNKVPLATTYRVQIAYNSDFSTIVADTTGLPDTTVTKGGLASYRNHYWHVRGINGAGSGAWSTTFGFRTVQVVSVETGPELPTEYQLSQNYPNPFNPTTAISFQLPAASKTRIVVYDLLGREVAVLVDDFMPTGSYTITWNAGSVASGVYLCRMTAGGFAATRRMVLLR
jgi:uncharacterized lipoprotein YddW (UPF0748 family)